MCVASREFWLELFLLLPSSCSLFDLSVCQKDFPRRRRKNWSQTSCPISNIFRITARTSRHQCQRPERAPDLASMPPRPKIPRFSGLFFLLKIRACQIVLLMEVFQTK
jgi:hypothetical protein